MNNLHSMFIQFKNINSIIIIFFLVFVLCPISSFPKADKSKSGNNIVKNEVKDNSRGTIEKENSSKSDKRDQALKGTDSKSKKEKEGDLYTFEKPSVEDESYTWLIIKTIIVLGALVGGFYYFFRFVTRKTGIQILGRDVVRILSIVPLGQNKFLQVVDLAGKVLVLGVSENNINLITEVKDRDEIDRIRIISSKSSPVQPGGFQEYISNQIGKFLKKGKSKTGIGQDSSKSYGEDRMDYLRRQRDRLRNINNTDNSE